MRSTTAGVPAQCLAAPRPAASIFGRVSVSPPGERDASFRPCAGRASSLPRPGLLKVSCDIHADMAAFILLTPGAAWARTAAGGRCELAGLAAGRHRVRSWHPDATGGSAGVQVPADGAVTLDVDL